ncbi:MAG: cysteine synthase A [Clostridia bacterium]|nr:cysteine synthase A [Clostridia bacterium]
MKIYSSVEELIGSTPLLELKKLKEREGLLADIYAKLEFFNPLCSIKDRVAKQMLDDAQSRGEINENSVIIEPTSGNTGIGLAAVAATRGIKAKIVMPENMSRERIAVMKALGAEVVLTPASEGMSGAIKRAEELAKEIPNSFIPAQFDNPSNPRAHLLTTGPEIWQDTDGKVDIFVAAAGTGGTISGAGEYLKNQNSNIKVVAVEPESSAVLSGGKAGPHKIQGIGAGFIPKVMNTEIFDEVIAVSNEKAFEYGRKIAKSEGILVGISSGAALCAAVELAKRSENKDKKIVVILPDTGDRYLSTEMFE